MTQIIIEGHADEAETLTYRHLPFEVPDGTQRIEVHYEYSAAIGSDPQLTGGNTVDIGIFDPRGADFLAQGFRGWSGSARSEFFLATDDATPGYLPGPIQPGRWNICLGLYKVARDGCDYKVTVRLQQVDTTGVRAGFAPRLMLSDAPRPELQKADGWYRGELHCHTVHSDGDSTPAEMIAVAESLGLDFLAVTDHNNITHLADLRDIDTRLMLIPGYEVTTYKGHWNIWGGEGWIDFRILTPEHMTEAIEAALGAGYLVSCNHPRPYGPPWEFEEVRGYHCVEVWNGPWELFNNTSLAFWEKRLNKGEKLVAVGGSDAHFLHRDHIARIGQPTMWIHCEGAPSPAKLLQHLRAGHAFISAGTNGPHLTLYCDDAMMGDTISHLAGESAMLQIDTREARGLQLQVWGKEGCLIQIDVDQDESVYELRVPVRSSSYIRAQLVDRSTDPGDIRALTNPIYID